MLWYKSWLETRWRFVIGFVLLMLSAFGTVVSYPRVMELMPMATSMQTGGGELGRRIREGVELARSYRGYVWSQAFAQNLPQMATLFAVLLGSGSVLASGRSALFMLSLPASRNRVLGIRAATGLAELFALAIGPALFISLLSPAVGEHYRFVDAVVHGLCMFVAAAVFYSLALLLSTVFSDLWRPLLLTCAVAVVISVCGLVFRGLARYGIFGVMSGDSYFRGGAVPWVGLLASAIASIAMLYGAAANIARRDF